MTNTNKTKQNNTIEKEPVMVRVAKGCVKSHEIQEDEHNESLGTTMHTLMIILKEQNDNKLLCS